MNRHCGVVFVLDALGFRPMISDLVVFPTASSEFDCMRISYRYVLLSNLTELVTYNNIVVLYLTSVCITRALLISSCSISTYVVSTYLVLLIMITHC